MATTMRECERLGALPFPARYPGECCVCSMRFPAGALITSVEDGDRPLYAHADCDEGTAPQAVEFDSAGVLSPAQRAAVIEVLASPEYRRLERMSPATEDHDAEHREDDDDF